MAKKEKYEQTNNSTHGTTYHSDPLAVGAVVFLQRYIIT